MQPKKQAEYTERAAAASGEGTVLEFSSDGSEVRVRSIESGQTGWAKLALPVGSRPGLGSCLLIQELGGRAYATALLAAKQPASAQKLLNLSDGAQVLSEAQDSGDSVLTLTAPDGTLLLDYDAKTSRVRIHAAEGGVEIDSGSSDLNLSSEGTVAIRGRNLDFAASHSIDLTSSSADAAVPGSSIRLGQRAASVRTQHLEIENKKANWKSDVLNVSAERSTLKGQQAKLTAERVETVASTLIQRLGSAFIQADELLQQRAGELRQSAKNSFVMRCGRAMLRSKKKFKVDGESIHIG